MRLDVDLGGAATTPSAPAAGEALGWSSQWRRSVLLLAGVWAVILLLLLSTAQHMVGVWIASATFNHCFLLVPIVGWLVWQRKDALQQLEPRPYAPGLILMAGGAVVWLLGWVASISLVEHAALIFLLQTSVLTLLGVQVARALLFPLGFMIFLVPFGEEIVPYLQIWAADFAVWALRALGVPTVTDGVMITIPNGAFKVAEECSGIRFLIAGLALAALYGNLAFKGWRKQIVVMILGMLAPIIANWIRVFGIIYIAHLSTPATAKIVDNIVYGHQFYGWMFFGVIMLIMFGIGRFFSDKTVEDPAVDVSTWDKSPAPAGAAKRLPILAAAAIAVAASAPALAYWSDHQSTNEVVHAIQPPQLTDWVMISPQAEIWKPIYKGASAEAFESYLRGGNTVELYLAAYDHESSGSKLISHGNGAAPPQSDWAWLHNTPTPVVIGDQRIETHAFQIRGGGIVRDVWQWYWINGKLVSSPYEAKLQSLFARLFGGERRAGVIIISAERGFEGESNAPAMAELLKSIGALDTATPRWFIGTNAASQQAG